MKKSIQFYILTVIATLSMQSCVSNYVASNPIYYKPDTKPVAVNNNLKIDKSAINNISKNNNVSFASLEKIELEESIKASIIREKTIDQILSQAHTYLGTPYRYGGTTRNGIDCSAFVLSAYGEGSGVALPRVASAQSTEGELVEKDKLEKGDLLFFSTKGGRISHVGIVEEVTPEGEIKFIHSSTSHGVAITSLTNSSYWSAKYRFAKRIIKENN